ncbi:MAG: sigma-70 family RNA polymerase sigma factor [Bacteroidetes bacterium]|nr:sigma-70 family RNA polymerase sigma factor [Bacteroidota bacterium]
MQTQFHLRKEAKILTAALNLKTLSDRELVDRYVDGDESCLEVLIERHKGLIFGFIVKRVRDQMLAEDIFQETFFKVIRSLKSKLYNEEDKFLQWVMRISRNMIIDHYRRSGRVRMVSTVRNKDGEQTDIFNVIDVSENVHSTHVEKRQAHRHIRKLIKKLPIEQRQVLVMREYLDMSFNEICKMYKMNLNTALGRMRYAINNLKKMAKEESLSY